MNTKNILKATWSGAVLAPISLVVIQFLALQLRLSNLGILITLYKHKPLAIHEIIQWLLLSSPEALRATNLLAVTIAWVVSWIIVADWVKRIDDSAIALFLTYIIYIFYLSWYRKIPVILYFPESFTPIPLALLFTALVVYVERRRHRLSFFEILERANIRVPPHYKVGVEVPLKCPSCGAIIYSNPQYCWKCGANLEERVYKKLVR